ncbi:MAG: hypothetical protein MJ252_22475 [archaeon]|nr:hypothetical protein [archaeon]
MSFYNMLNTAPNQKSRKNSYFSFENENDSVENTFRKAQQKLPQRYNIIVNHIADSCLLKGENLIKYQKNKENLSTENYIKEYSRKNSQNKVLKPNINEKLGQTMYHILTAKSIPRNKTFYLSRNERINSKEIPHNTSSSLLNTFKSSKSFYEPKTERESRGSYKLRFDANEQMKDLKRLVRRGNTPTERSVFNKLGGLNRKDPLKSDIFIGTSGNQFIQKIKEKFPEYTNQKISTKSFINYKAHEHKVISTHPNYLQIRNQIKNMF